MTVVVGVDVGSSSARAIALDRDGAIRGSAGAAYVGRDSWAPGHADPRSWRAAVDEAVGALVARLPTAARPAAFAVGGQSPCVVRSDGSDAITINHPSANGTDPAEAHVRMWHEISAPDLVPMQAWDWILHTMGAPHTQGRWPGVPDLPGFGPPVRSGTAVGDASPAAPVAAGTPLVPGSPDAFMAFWAAGIDTPGLALDPGGRSGGIGIAVAGRPGEPREYSLRSPAIGVDIVGGPVMGHGLIVDWWCRMTGRTVEAALAEAAGVVPGANGVLVLPYLNGERAPRWNSDLRAEIIGLSEAAGPGEVMRAILEACAFGLRHIVESVADQGAVLDKVVVAGSPALSPLWNQIKADVLGVPVAVPAMTDLAAYGSALAAGAAIGWWPRPGEGASGAWPRVPTTDVEPRSVPIYDEAYRRWVAAGDAAVVRQAEDAAATSSQK